MDAIHGFQGEHRFLSNFWSAEVELDGVRFDTVEHAYQAAKFKGNYTVQVRIRAAATPGRAKRAGGIAWGIRPDWGAVKVEVMQGLLEQKFAIPELRELLLATGDAYLEETNIWGDRFWGVCNGTGENNLGKLLMEIRGRIRQETADTQ